MLLNALFSADNKLQPLPFRCMSRLPEREVAERVKYSNIGYSDWPRGKEIDVEGPNFPSDWSAKWSDDSETGGFYSNSQSEVRSAFVTEAEVNRPYEGRDGVVRPEILEPCVIFTFNCIL